MGKETSPIANKVSKAFKDANTPSVFLQMIGRVLQSPCSKKDLMGYFKEEEQRLNHGYYSMAFLELKKLNILTYNKNTALIELGNNFPTFLMGMLEQYPQLKTYLVKQFTKADNNSIEFINRIQD
jgi:hypothetical protein